MNIPTKKLRNSFEMPVFGIGTYNIIPEDNLLLPKTEREKEIRTIKAAIEFGVTHIDTAEAYAQGETEKLVGEALKNFNRKNLFLVSKAKDIHLNQGQKGIREAIKGSLERLQTDYLDLYLMHRCPPLDKFKECVDAMNELVDEGLVKAIGLSNTNTQHSRELCALTRHPFVVNQCHLNLQVREIEADGLLNFCQSNDLFLEAWRPVNKGALTKSGTDITKPGIPILDEMCKKYNKTPAQISLNWLISQNNVTTIVKNSDLNHLKENLGSLGWQMEKEDIEKLRKEFPDQKFISDTVPLA